ncbi:hypothetical protein Si004_00483 [Streptococcus infantarius subsp. infantarius]|uniref:hypothetical protein n=1 Tax=Streptococcus lutetiensis TaxID=150055 RepID=UPI000FE231CE|nr:hypothetical protein [Streptococcus lutetiensis]MCO4489310.1 hypothetical protein [Streptococcus infantarius subsp. infantarius]MCO4648861.1 hypothetical protein [Streptococcus infantarius subsp. infantarius]MCO4653135.1 hypothetical protein [Streptococcus infantarius subsp. infantarius]MCO4656396.1 hypothetical protein [Streptococcus infantarius subsp. infantarius]MCO4663967.1 hypothetical protein [Streptococcus infantarius subsp. infantarius]
MAYNWQQFKNGLFGFSYDYTELLAELKTDVATGDVGDKIVVIRYRRDDTDYRPIRDYLHEGESVSEDEEYSFEKTDDVLEEMEAMNRIF